jgi:extracellular elastinolytic metalloproteinase
MKINPNHYENLTSIPRDRVHSMGEVWSTMLYEVFWNMVEKSGFSNYIQETRKKAGNTRFIQLIVTAMKLQPCNPNFITARDAIIYADSITYSGMYNCEIWKGFAKRGLGVGAVGGRRGRTGGKRKTNSFEVPSHCRH